MQVSVTNRATARSVRVEQGNAVSDAPVMFTRSNSNGDMYDTHRPRQAVAHDHSGRRDLAVRQAIVVRPLALRHITNLSRMRALVSNAAMLYRVLCHESTCHLLYGTAPRVRAIIARLLGSDHSQRKHLPNHHSYNTLNGFSRASNQRSHWQGELCIHVALQLL